MPAVITGIAHYVPPVVLGNAELSTRLGVTENWIVERTGIRERRIAVAGGTSDLILPAANECLRRAGVNGADVDCVIVSTITPDHITPSTASILINRLGADRAWGFDLSAACSGFLYGLVTAAQFVETGAASRVLVAGADRMSCITDPTDRRTAVLLGDGAGVALVERGTNPSFGLHDFLLSIDARGERDVVVPAGGSKTPASTDTIAGRQHCLYISGRPVFDAAVEGMSFITTNLMERNGLSPTDLDWFVPHQANLRILEAVAHRLQVPWEKVVVNVDRFGNTSAATIPIALSEWWEAGRLRPGNRVVLTGFGAGYALGTVYLTWGSGQGDGINESRTHREAGLGAGPQA